MATPTVYLISGANRGIGLGLVKQLLLRANVIVFAGARQPSTALDLQQLSSQHPGKLHVLPLVSGDEAGNRAAVSEIQRKAGRLDVVIANAGICNFVGPAMDTPPETMREHYEVNVIGTLVLFQATYPLLSTSTPNPKFIPISSGAGSIQDGTKLFLKVMAYGASKAAENYMARRLYYEYPNLICFPISPGPVQTDIRATAVAADPEVANMPAQSVEQAAADILKRVDDGKRTDDGPLFVRSDNGESRPW